MRDRNYFIGCLLQVITHTSLTQVCVYDTLRQSGFASFTQNSHKLPKRICQSKKKTTQTASLRGFLAGAVRIELTTRGFGVMVGVSCIVQHRLASCEKARRIGIFKHSTFYIVECFLVSFSNF